MANGLISTDLLTKDSLVRFMNSLTMAKTVYRDYEDNFQKVGDTIRVRRPVHFEATEGPVITTIQDIEEGTVSVTLDRQVHVDFALSSKDLTLTIDQIGERYLQPAMERLANKVDTALHDLYSSVPSWVGTPGEVVNSNTDFILGPQRLDLEGVPKSDRKATFHPLDYWGLIGNQSTIFNEKLVKDAYQDGDLKTIGGVSLYEAQNVRAHTVGAHGGTPLVNGAGQFVTYASVKTTLISNVITDGWTISTQVLNKGDVVTFAGVFAVNPVTNDPLSHLREFVVTADVTSDGGGAATIPVYPAIITSGPYKTVTAAPADNAAIVVKGTASTAYNQSMIYHKNAFGLVMRPLDLPKGAVEKSQKTYENFSMRIVGDYDITNDRSIYRADILFGVVALNPRFATRISGTP